jgi:hypothetical protein
MDPKRISRQRVVRNEDANSGSELKLPLACGPARYVNHRNHCVDTTSAYEVL